MFKLLLILPFFCSLSLAQSQLLATFLNQEDDSIVNLYVDLDDRKDIKSLEIKRFVDEKIKNHKGVDASVLLEGMTVGEVRGFEILKLYSTNFSRHQGGEIVLNYLCNILTGSRNTVTLDIYRNGDDWEMSHLGNPVETLHVISKRVFGKPIGIQRLDFIYKE